MRFVAQHQPPSGWACRPPEMFPPSSDEGVEKEYVMRLGFKGWIAGAALLLTIAGAPLSAAAAPQDAHGTCGVGGPSQNGATGCAGNVGGVIFAPNNECRQINQGPFNEFSC